MTKLRMGVVGTGIFGERHLQTYSSYWRSDLSGIFDINLSRAMEMKNKYGARKVYNNLEEMLDDSEIDGISIATPDNLHRDVAVAAAKAGKHILIEKPLSTNLSEAKDIIDAVRDNNIFAMVDFHNRINPQFTILKDSIAGGEIGELKYMYFRLSNTLAVPMKMLSWSGNSSSLWFLGSHIVDLGRWLCQSEVKKISAVSRMGVLSSKGINCPDFYVATLEFENGTVGVFENSWILPTTQPTVKDFLVEILGDKGAFYVDGANNRTVQKYTADKYSFPDLFAVNSNPRCPSGFVFESIRYFVDAVLDTRQPLATVEDGFENTKILCGIEEAAKSGNSIQM